MFLLLGSFYRRSRQNRPQSQGIAIFTGWNLTLSSTEPNGTDPILANAKRRVHHDYGRGVYTIQHLSS